MSLYRNGHDALFKPTAKQTTKVGPSALVRPPTRGHTGGKDNGSIKSPPQPLSRRTTSSGSGSVSVSGSGSGSGASTKTNKTARTNKTTQTSKTSRTRRFLFGPSSSSGAYAVSSATLFKVPLDASVPAPVSQTASTSGATSPASEKFFQSSLTDIDAMPSNTLVRPPTNESGPTGNNGLFRPTTKDSTTSSIGTNGTSGTKNKRMSLSSFPPSRSPSQTSGQSRRFSRSPQPPVDTNGRISHQSSKGPSSGVSSKHSSMEQPEFNPNAHPRRKLRSQYPRGETENHVEYILVASFDIDRGPIMEHQFPVAITGDEHMLAELMLPDQAHVRNQDWTIFFLHKDTSQEEEEAEMKAERRRRRKRRKDIAAGLIVSEEEDQEEDVEEDLGESSSDESEPEGGEGPPLIYVLNLVNTKQDKTAKRGAVVKAMAICTRHPFLHIYKPLLLLALEEYFKVPHPTTLAILYDAVNTMDLSLMPRLTILERHLLQASDNKDLFVEKFEQMIQMRMAEDRAERSSDQEKLENSVGQLKRPADLTRNGTREHIDRGRDSEYSVPRDTHEFETKVVYNGIPIPIKVPVAVSPETVGDFSLIKLIQTFSEPHAKAPQAFNLHQHLTTGGAYTHPIIVLVNAMLTQKRVIFLGYNLPSGEVAEAVLAACALASGGILRGFTRHAFPYTDLSKIDDLLKVPGFVAGVTNPTFENHPEWWDVLCDLPTGRIKVSSRIEQAPVTEGLQFFQQQNPQAASATNVSNSTGPTTNDPTGDAAFMADVLRSIAARHGEGVIRAKWRHWVEKFTRIAGVFEEVVYGATALSLGGDKFNNSNANTNGHGYVWSDEASKQRELAGNASRIEGWRVTRSYYSLIQDLAQLYTFRPLKNLDLHHLHDRLRTQKLTQQGSSDIYTALSNLTSYDEICLLLTVAPESQAGLFYLALGLFHKDREVRMRVVDLLERISAHEAGRHWWKALSKFEKLALVRIKREAEQEAKVRGEIEMYQGNAVQSLGAGRRS